jgi:hypothetical protein
MQREKDIDSLSAAAMNGLKGGTCRRPIITHEHCQFLPVMN